MRKTGSFPILNFLNRRQLNLADAEVFLDLYNQAALLLDLHNGSILIANARATELTAFTRLELVEMGVNTLLPAIEEDSRTAVTLTRGRGFESKLITRSGLRLDIYITLHRVDAPAGLFLAVIEPTSLRAQELQEQVRQNSRFENLNELVLATQTEDVPAGMAAALEATHGLTGAGILAVYLVDTASLRFRLVVERGAEAILPVEILPDDFSSSPEPELWIPGKRANTALKRAARTAHLSYLATVPIDPQGLSGLVVMADTEIIPSSNELPLLKILASTLTTLIQHQTLASNLMQAQRDQRRALTTSETMEEASADGIIILDGDLNIRKMNPAAELSLGFALEEVHSQPIENIIVGPENLLPSLQLSQQGIPTHNLSNIRLHRRDGTDFLATLRIVPVQVGQEIESVIVFLRDLAEMEQYQLQNQQLQQRAFLGDITSVFAHEVRNPLNNLSTAVQYLAMQLPDNDPNKDTLNRMEGDCNRMEQLMQSVLDFNRTGHTRKELVDLDALISRVTDRWRPRLAKINVKYSLQFAPEKSFIHGDARSLEQVFANLYSNATQAMSESGGDLVIKINHLEPEDGKKKIEVLFCDTGPGIPDRIKSRIFEPYFTNSRNGTGLGLAISDGIITTHKGKLSFESVPGGTVFKVVLPAVSPNELIQ